MKLVGREDSEEDRLAVCLTEERWKAPGAVERHQKGYWKEERATWIASYLHGDCTSDWQ